MINEVAEDRDHEIIKENNQAEGTPTMDKENVEEAWVDKEEVEVQIIISPPKVQSLTL